MILKRLFFWESGVYIITGKKQTCLKISGVCKPYGLEKEQLIYDAYEKNYLYKNLLTDISDQLNNIHNVSHTLRYWEIIVGPWLNSYLLVIANRYKTLINMHLKIIILQRLFI